VPVLLLLLLLTFAAAHFCFGRVQAWCPRCKDVALWVYLLRCSPAQLAERKDFKAALPERKDVQQAQHLLSCGHLGGSTTAAMTAIPRPCCLQPVFAL
jgi:hypothetical protein